MANYFVATSGKDSNPGTKLEPFASVNKAAEIAQPGDVIHVRGGTYRQKVE